MAESKYGQLKKPRGKVRHVLFDPNNPKHVEDFEKLSDTGEAGDHKLLQYYKGEISGYVDFTVGKDVVDINFIYVEPELRDTLSIKKKPSEAELEMEAEKLKLILKRHKAENISMLPKSEQKKFERLARKREGIQKREFQLLLGAKMLGHLAKTHGKPLTTATFRGQIAQKGLEKHMRKYTTELFKKRGAQKSRKRR